MRHIDIIAEIGCNHCGNPEIARQMVEVAKECGVDGVKFQTFKASDLISKFAPKAEYQRVTTGTEESQLEMTQKLELNPQDYIKLRQYALDLGLKVFSTPFDMGSIQFLEEIGQSIWKIPSGEITNLPYLERISKIKVDGKTIILSTGMSTIQEIQDAIDIICRHEHKDNIVILHCNTEYPTPDEDVNIMAIDALRAEFPGFRIGFSDHSNGYLAAVGACTKEIVLIEKHFTLNKNLPGPDHKASADPEELKNLCRNVRRMEILIGNPEKKVTDSERRNIAIARKSIVAKYPISKGEILTEENITCKRPGTGISPMRWYEVLGRTAIRNFDIDELIEL